MDPQFTRKAHREWFLDGIGYLRIAKDRFEVLQVFALLWSFAAGLCYIAYII